jgi:HD-GYP domain-containing protein (c-di-GMP phosphodiesterase class II)
VDYFVAVVHDITQRKEHEMELEVVASVSSALRVAQSRNQMIPLILDQITKVTKVDGIILLLCDPSTNEMVVEHGRGEWAEFTGLRLPQNDTFFSKAFSTGSMYTFENLPLNIGPGPGTRPHKLSGIFIPLIAGDQPVGAFFAGRSKAFIPQEKRLLNSIANIAANALRRATLYEQTEQSLQRLNILHKIDTAISASHDLNTTLTILLDHIRSYLGVDAVDVLIYNTPNKIFQHAAGRGFHSSFTKFTHERKTLGLLGPSCLKRQRVSIPDISRDNSEFARFLQQCGEGFVGLHRVPLIARDEVKGLLEIFTRKSFHPGSEWLNFLEVLAGQASIAIDNAQLFDRLARWNNELTHAYDATIEGWSRALELRDLETQGHSQRVTEMTVELAEKIGIVDQDQLTQVRRGALLHDIGKMGLPDGILLKAGPLNTDEWGIMRQHPVYAHNMLAPIDFLRPALKIPYCHHEKWDGSGYPIGLQGDEIPLEARIFTIVDVWDALISDRPYRSAWSKEKAHDYLVEQSGKHFDPTVVEIFLQTI